jgi:hypothetical protein
MNPCMGFLPHIPAATCICICEKLYPNVQIRVKCDMDMGSPGKPQGYPCQSLIPSIQHLAWVHFQCGSVCCRLGVQSLMKCLSDVTDKQTFTSQNLSLIRQLA